MRAQNNTLSASMHLHEWYGCMQSIQHGLLSNLAHENGRCQRICAVCSRTCPWRHSVTKHAHLYWRTDALPMKLAFDLERRTGVHHLRYPEAPRQPEKAVTCGENQAARNQTVDAPSVHELNARWKTPVHAHSASNHTMDTTGTCHPQKLRWHALTWMSIRHRRNKRCATIPQMPHKTHAFKKKITTGQFLTFGKT